MPSLDALKRRPIQIACTGFLLFFFIGGAMHHAFGFGGIQAGGHSELWHGTNMLMCLLSIFCVLSSRELGYWWLLTVFISEIPIEARGALMSVGGPVFKDQVVETLLNIACLGCLLATKHRYFR